MSHHRYEPRGPQAITLQAMFWLFPDVDAAENDERGDATIVTIRGPLTQHGGWFESYEAIRARVDEACKQLAPVVVLRIDSPGGEVAGLFDTARAIRAACDAAGKRLLVHVEGQCSSAAYAIACVADRIMASTTADVGSIGVIACRLDETVADALNGFKVALITSGARKADWNPHAPLGAAELAAHQAEVDGLATEFFALVSTYREGLSAAAVEALEAGSFRGQAAVDRGLVDELGSFDHLLASLGAGASMKGTDMDPKEKEARDALRSIAEDEERGDEERERARRALAALDPVEEEAPAEDDEAAPPGDEGEGAEGEEDDKEAEKAAKTPSTVSASTAGALAAHGADVEKRLVALERREATAERKRLIGAHGGVPEGMAKLLATKPLDEVRAILAELPKPKRPKLGDAAATATVAGTRGKDQAGGSQLPPAEAKAMRLAMGLDAEKFGVVERGNVLLLGAPEPTEGGE